METEERHRLSQFAGICCYIFGLGWAIGSLLIIAGNVILLEGVKEIATSPTLLTDADAQNLHLATGWWLNVAGDLIFMFSNMCFILAIVCTVWLHARNDSRILLLTLVMILWITISMMVDTLLAGSAWIFGAQTGYGLDPQKVTDVYQVYYQYSNNLLRWPTRGFYFFTGLSLILLSRFTRQLCWPAGVRYACLFFGIALWIEVLTFAVTVFTGSSPIQLPAYYLNFCLAAPTWAWVMGRALRRKHFIKNNLP